VLWAKNPKAPTRDEVEGVARSIIRFGFGAALVARLANREVIAGHTRLAAVRLLPVLHAAYLLDPKAKPWSYDAERIAKGGPVPCRFLDLSEDDAHLSALADNELGADWEPEALLEMLKQLQAEERSLAGWSEEQFQGLVGDGGRPDGVDEVPPVPKKAKSKLGERYELGPHVLVCGDSTDEKAWALLLGDERLSLVWTDPPYGVEIVGGNHSLSPAQRKAKGGKIIKNDELSPEQLRAFLDAAFAAAIAHCSKGASWYVAAPAIGPLFGAFGNALLATGIWRHTLIWLKDSLVMGRCDYHYRHEPIFYGWEPSGPHFWSGARTLDSVLEFPRPKKSTEHPTMKPPELIAHCIENSSKPDALVGDPFGGSGSTLIACARTGRRARLIELDPGYCDVIRKRWGDFARSAGIEPGSGAL
jgi:DNA modification methylase